MAKKQARFSKHTATSLAGFLETAFGIRDSWNDQSPDLIDPWYRGHSHIGFQLVPGMLRRAVDEDDETEDDLRLDFKQKAIPLLDFPAPASEWEWYFLMQHYGLPTRLLDWSESALVALHFATSGNQGKHNAVVWMLDPWRLNEHSLGSEEIHLSTDKEVSKYLADPYTKKWDPPRLPAAIYPAHSFRRIAAQCGFFTVHGVAKPLQDQVPADTNPMLAKIVIPGSKTAQIRRDLRHAGVTDATIFPDLAGLAMSIRREWIDDNG